MKKLTALILTMTMAALLSSCGGSGSYGGSTVSTTTASKSTKVKDKEYVLDYSGSELPGKYTGDWAEGMPDGYGEFT